MKIEIRSTGEQHCQQCGATPLIVTRDGLRLEAELTERRFPWWKPFARRFERRFYEQLTVILDELRTETRKV
jgi:hypothetical protein